MYIGRYSTQIPCVFLVLILFGWKLSLRKFKKFVTISYGKLTSKIREYHGKCRNVLYLRISEFPTRAH